MLEKHAIHRLCILTATAITSIQDQYEALKNFLQLKTRTEMLVT